MLFISFRHMAGGFNIQKGLFEGISRKLERCTSPDTLALVQNSWLLPLFFISTLFRHIPTLLSLPPPVFSFPYSFFFLSLSLSITLLHLQMWHCLDTFVLLRQTADLPKADVMLYLKKKSTMSS